MSPPMHFDLPLPPPLPSFPPFPPAKIKCQVCPNIFRRAKLFLAKTPLSLSPSGGEEGRRKRGRKGELFSISLRGCCCRRRRSRYTYVGVLQQFHSLDFSGEQKGDFWGKDDKKVTLSQLPLELVLLVGRPPQRRMVDGGAVVVMLLLIVVLLTPSAAVALTELLVVSAASVSSSPSCLRTRHAAEGGGAVAAVAAAAVAAATGAAAVVAAPSAVALLLLQLVLESHPLEGPASSVVRG